MSSLRIITPTLSVTATQNTKSRVIIENIRVGGQSNFRCRGGAVLWPVVVPVLIITLGRLLARVTILAHCVSDITSIRVLRRQGYKGTGWSLLVHNKHPSIDSELTTHFSQHAIIPNQVHFLYFYPRPDCVAYPWRTSIR